MNFSFPEHLNKSIISELENYVIYLCNNHKTYDDLSAQSLALWQWAGVVLAKTPAELRHEIESHEADEKFADKYQEEKDHLLKLPLLILEFLNSREI